MHRKIITTKTKDIELKRIPNSMPEDKPLMPETCGSVSDTQFF